MIDYPGEVSTILFARGCNFRCRYCHNPQLVLPQQYTDSIPEPDVIRFLHSRKGKLTGVVVSGGEPTVQHDLVEFLAKVRSMRYKIKLDTNGSNPEMLHEILGLGLVDYIAMDIKTSFDDYPDITQVPGDISTIQKSIRLIKESAVAREFRVTLVKRLHEPKNANNINAYLGPEKITYKSYKHVSRVIDTSLSTINEFSDEELQVFLDNAS
ncbi:MAG: anaerobic ribonucleoside-triphosphate reductase activating protein [Ignavibacteria bacterium]|nr:anaerobic ribonucleoside-triphosphate reductase activating protein [Ignavibacteria bacterium]